MLLTSSLAAVPVSRSQLLLEVDDEVVVKLLSEKSFSISLAASSKGSDLTLGQLLLVLL